MKQARLICMIALAGAVAMGCGTVEAGSAATGGSPATGGSGTGGSGTGGSGGTGGGGEGACTTAENTAVYDGLMYTNDDGEASTGSDAAAAIAGDCVFGAPPRCGAETGAVLGDNSPETRAALADCVVACTEMLAPLTADCLECYGGSVTCGAAFCAGECAGGTDTPGCVQCRTDNNCFSDFAECSGL